MGANAAELWRETRKRNTQGKAGKLYEHLMAETLGCVLSPRGQPQLADIHSLELRSRIEVKAGGDRGSIEIKVEQLRRYEGNLPFPDFDHTLYVICPYRSSEYAPRSLTMKPLLPDGFSEKTKGVSLLRSLKTDTARNRFWAENILTTYLLDMSIVQGLERKWGVHPCRQVDRSDEMVVRVTPKKLFNLFRKKPFEQALRSIGLKPGGYAEGVYPLQVHFKAGTQSLQSKFELVTILRKGLHADVAKVIASKTLALV